MIATLILQLWLVKNTPQPKIIDESLKINKAHGVNE